MNAFVSVVLSKARSFLGQMENPPNSNNHPTVKWYNETIEYLARTWNYCAAGVSRAFHGTVAAALHRPRAYVPWEMQDFLPGGKNYEAGGRLYWIDNWDDLLRYFRSGCVVFYDWEATKRHSVWVGDHVGLGESIRPDQREVVVIEHNTSVPGTGNQGTTRKVRDAKYIAAVGVPGYPATTPPSMKIPGTDLPLLSVDGDMGAKTIFAYGTVMKARGYRVTPARTVRPDLVKAIQQDLNKRGIRDRDGRRLVEDGKGIGSNSRADYPRSGWTRTITALQIGHGVKRSRADGVLSKGNSDEVRRIQRDINLGGVKDSPNYTG